MRVLPNLLTVLEGVKKVYFGCKNDKFGGCGSVLSVNSVEYVVCVVAGTQADTLSKRRHSTPQ